MPALPRLRISPPVPRRCPPRCARIALGLGLVLCVARGAAAEPPSGSAPRPGSGSAPRPGTAAAVKLAAKHFRVALADYRDGAYREAITELDQAIALDPHGKDLVYNRALVYEKLGDIDRAITEYQRYARMETDRHEIARARAIVRRLEGARREVEGGATRASAPDRQTDAASRHGRMDGWVIGAGGVAIVAAAIGSFFGIRALATEPSADASTGGGTSYADVQADAERAHGFAVVADISFAIALASGASAGALYMLRAPAPPQSAQAWRGAPGVVTLGVHF